MDPADGFDGPGRWSGFLGMMLYLGTPDASAFKVTITLPVVVGVSKVTPDCPGSLAWIIPPEMLPVHPGRTVAFGLVIPDGFAGPTF